ncbi:hypothetical protein [Caballeronia calidae]|uniref:hypothetical protein n=1 Tax=Caballeronia calidae TaxID=1777139 RepID=UPI000B2B0BAF|nr:hypothetical protein [Caballeronia calidae]
MEAVDSQLLVQTATEFGRKQISETARPQSRLDEVGRKKSGRNHQVFFPPEIHALLPQPTGKLVASFLPLAAQTTVARGVALRR